MSKSLLKDKILSIVLIVSMTFFIISLSIFLPLDNRHFYYNQIDSLNIVEDLNEFTGEAYTKEDVKEAFDDVMDFIWKGTEFKTGKLKFSESGKSHFEDCVGLFWLDLIVLIVTTVIIATLMVLLLFKKWKIYDFHGFSPMFYSGVIALLIVLLIGAFGLCVGFDKLFEIFHRVFFPGKDNWLFNPYTDEVILILPEDFFMNCAIFIAVGFLILSTGSIAYGIVKRNMLMKKVSEN